MIETLLLSTTPVATFQGQVALTSATGFFFERDDALFLVTCRHVLLDPSIGHEPDRIEIEVHTDPTVLGRTAVVSILLQWQGERTWRQAYDSAGEVDVVALPIDRQAWPAQALVKPFRPEHLVASLESVHVGDDVLVPGYPLGFYDTVHRLPVVRQACIASAFGIRFQGHGYFLTDARTHRGSSGAPVVVSNPAARGELPWQLLGIHSSRLDMSNRHQQEDESLGLNCAWYADALLGITAP